MVNLMVSSLGGVGVKGLHQSIFNLPIFLNDFTSHSIKLIIIGKFLPSNGKTYPSKN